VDNGKTLAGDETSTFIISTMMNDDTPFSIRAACFKHILYHKMSSSASDTDSPTSLLPNGCLPAYLADAFGDLYGEDGLAVLGRGLGALSLLASLMRFYVDMEEGHVALLSETNETTTAANTTKKPPLVLVLGLKDEEGTALTHILQSWNTPSHMLPTFITNESGQSKDRVPLYRRGGVFCVTSRILIVDLLSNIVSCNDIDGMLVFHAETVTPESMEAFILRIFYSQKQPFGSGFCKAITSDPDRLLSGFAKVDKIMKALYVRKLYLYPRFLHCIREELELRPPNVVELHQSLTVRQQEIQSAIVAAVQSVIRELKSSTTMIAWTEPELKIENCVSSSFDRTISRQLERDWHRLKPQTKQLVQDLRTLRTLFQSLIHYDCITFYTLLLNLKTMSAKTRYPSMWLLTPAADVLFRKSKERLYQIVRPKSSKAVEKPVAKLTPILEPNPKCKLLQQVLSEIREEYNKKQLDASNIDNGPTTVLVMVDTERTRDMIQSYLVDGTSRTLLLRWLRYLETMNDRARQKRVNQDEYDDLPEEDRLLMEEESRVRRILFRSEEQQSKKTTTTKQLNQVPAHIKKRRRVAVEKGRGQAMHQADDLERQAVLDEAVEDVEQELEESRQLENEKKPAALSNSSEEDDLFQVHYPDELRVVLKSYSSIEGNEALLLLQEMSPKYVVLYDADIGFIRSIEIYSALQMEDNPMKVFLLLFEASAEEKTFTKSLEREQNAFERLIHHKKTMAPPIIQVQATQEMQQALLNSGVVGSYNGGTLPLSCDSRRAKVDTSKERRDVVVDVREFRSSLPSILHQGGMRLAPVTLIVGDFVLSSVHCVERKSISDLFGSFASGRLYTQAEAMSKHYNVPCLLIEFDPDKSFGLLNSNDLGSDIRQDSITTKLSILAIHFPRLRILWSKSPHDTVKIFQKLKRNREEPDVERAMQVGRSESAEALLEAKPAEGDESPDEVNEAARNVLLSLPGVNVHTARRIMDECDTLAELVEMSRDDLRRIAGPITGQKLFTFFRQKLAST
jgi:DNA excision repair protein ERCC-4